MLALVITCVIELHTLTLVSVFARAEIFFLFLFFPCLFFKNDDKLMLSLFVLLICRNRIWNEIILVEC